MSEFIIECEYDPDEGWTPGEQREEIVRCRDCEYVAHFFHHDDERWQCTNPWQDGDDVMPGAYCWRGKRKEVGEWAST